MVLWAAAHEDTKNQTLVREIQKDKQKFVRVIREQWLAGQKRRSVATSSADRKSSSGADHHKTQ
jgi:hypothetical protein